MMTEPKCKKGIIYLKFKESSLSAVVYVEKRTSSNYYLIECPSTNEFIL